VVNSPSCERISFAHEPRIDQEGLPVDGDLRREHRPLRLLRRLERPIDLDLLRQIALLVCLLNELLQRVDRRLRLRQIGEDRILLTRRDRRDPGNKS